MTPATPSTQLTRTSLLYNTHASDSTSREDQHGCVRPLNLLDNGGFQGANSVVFRCAVTYATRVAGSSAEEGQVEWRGPEVVLKGLVTPMPLEPGENTSRVHADLIRRQAADYEVLSQLPRHVNIVEVVHHFEAPAMLLRPFVVTAHLPFLCLSKTTCVSPVT